MIKEFTSRAEEEEEDFTRQRPVVVGGDIISNVATFVPSFTKMRGVQMMKHHG